MTQELEAQIKVVAEARGVLQYLKLSKVAAYTNWEAEAWFKALLDELYDASARVVGAEDKLRDLTLQAFADTGNKAPAVGVGIREVTTYSYDNVEALVWAKEHDLCLKLDDTAFKKQVKVSPLPFVTATTEPQATIAQDLLPE